MFDDHAGYVTVPVNATYTFSMAADDGAVLYIDGNLLINNTGAHVSLL